MQIQANAIGKTVVRPKVTETTALGAAYLSGLAVGYWKNMDEIKKQWQVDRKFEPTENTEETHKTIANWKKAIERSKNWHR